MNWFNKLPGHHRCAPGWEHALWRRLPAIVVWGTVLLVLLAGLNHAFGSEAIPGSEEHRALLLADYRLIGIVVLHWTLCFTLALGCFIVRVMKGPAYVADAYPLEECDG